MRILVLNPGSSTLKASLVTDSDERSTVEAADWLRGQGARIIVKLASDPALDGVTGRFFSSAPGAGLVPTTSAPDVNVERRPRGTR